MTAKIHRTTLNYLMIAMLFIACKNEAGKKTRPVSTEILDTIKTSAPAITAQPAILENAFIKGTTEKGRTAAINFYGITIGELKVTSGRVIACDPLHIDEYGIPYTQVFPTGKFPVQLAIANVEGEETVAFARVNFSDEPVVRWELALIEGQQPLPVGGEEVHGYGVDAGVAIFMDNDGKKVLDTKKIWDMEGEHELFKEMDKHYHYDWRYTMYNFGQYNMAAFSSGLGDGRYASYIGYDAAGRPCRLTTDFGTVEWRKKK